MAFLPIHIVNRKRGMPPGAEYVGRPSPLGNPWPIGRGLDRTQAIAAYRRWLFDQWNDATSDAWLELLRLRGKLIRDGSLVLACWCTPLPCHAEVVREALLRLTGSLRVLVCGSRGYPYPEDVMDFVAALPEGVVVIEGECPNSPDVWAAGVAKDAWPFPTEWKKLGRKAGHVRNARMLSEGQPHLVAAFWDGQSSGTKGVLTLAAESGVPYGVVSLVRPDVVLSCKRIQDFHATGFKYLSTFYPRPIWFQQSDPLVALTSEHAYHAWKTENPEERAMVLACATPTEAKAAGRCVTMRTDWEDVKVDVMRAVQRRKFELWPDLRKQLLATGDAYLEEGNTWGDRYWGRVRGEGLNMLGRILMDLRSNLRTVL